ncbi:GNAT family N-acetyltransferase [Microbulbifer sp. JMSA002]|uniref:GNAT family N-acetyltransferase n=1 Tax=Microbulbifer sp. JMSA002 TaxID=3243368 RepID=UPI004039C269
MARLIQTDSKRLVLRQWREEDRGDFAHLNADTRVMRFFPCTLNRTKSNKLLNTLKEHIDEYGWGYWAVELKENGQFIGFAGIKHASAELPFSPSVVLGCRFIRDFWGRGYASEAAKAVFAVAFEQLNLTEVVGCTALQNLPSQRMMHGLGMSRDASIFDHPLVPENSPLRPHCLYRLSFDTWWEQIGGNPIKRFKLKL